MAEVTLPETDDPVSEMEILRERLERVAQDCNEFVWAVTSAPRLDKRQVLRAVNLIYRHATGHDRR